MKLALLGWDEDSGWLAAAASQAGHSLVWWGDLATAPAEFPVADDRSSLWEELLDRHLADAVLVGRGTATAELRIEQLGQLAKNGVAVLTTFPIVDSVLAYYELDMARRETGALFQHFNPLVEQTEFVDCERWLAEGHPEFGSIEQVVWERQLADRSQERVLWHFARDVELLGRTAGRLDRLGAHGSPNEAATYAGLSVQLLGESQVPVRWSIGPPSPSEGAQLTLIGQRGRVVMEQQTGDDQNLAAALAAISRLESALAQPVEDASTWPSALRAMELCDTIEISLRRGRMIEIHGQELTEELAFKGTMSAVGCGALMILPPVLLLLGWLSELVGLPIARFWPHLLFGLLALFLAFQLVPKLLLPSQKKE